MGGAFNGGFEVPVELTAARPGMARWHLLRHERMLFRVWAGFNAPKPHRRTDVHPTASPFPPSSHSLSFYILYSLLSLSHPHSFHMQSRPHTSSLHLTTRLLSRVPSSFLASEARSVWSPRPFTTLTRVARPFHTFKPNLILVTNYQTPRSAIYAGVMASSDDDVPLKARKMKTNGVKQGKESI